MPACDGCGSHVSTQFLKVFGKNDGTVEGCPRCMTNRELHDPDTANFY